MYSILRLTTKASILVQIERNSIMTIIIHPKNKENFIIVNVCIFGRRSIIVSERIKIQRRYNLQSFFFIAEYFTISKMTINRRFFFSYLNEQYRRITAFKEIIFQNILKIFKNVLAKLVWK